MAHGPMFCSAVFKPAPTEAHLRLTELQEQIRLVVKSLENQDELSEQEAKWLFGNVGKKVVKAWQSRHWMNSYFKYADDFVGALAVAAVTHHVWFIVLPLSVKGTQFLLKKVQHWQRAGQGLSFWRRMHSLGRLGNQLVQDPKMTPVGLMRAGLNAFNMTLKALGRVTALAVLLATVNLTRLEIEAATLPIRETHPDIIFSEGRRITEQQQTWVQPLVNLYAPIWSNIKWLTLDDEANLAADYIARNLWRPYKIWFAESIYETGSPAELASYVENDLAHGSLSEKDVDQLRVEVVQLMYLKGFWDEAEKRVKQTSDRVMQGQPAVDRDALRALIDQMKANIVEDAALARPKNFSLFQSYLRSHDVVQADLFKKSMESILSGLYEAQGARVAYDDRRSELDHKIQNLRDQND